MYAAVTLGFGVVVGTALDPGLTFLGAVGPAPVAEAVAPEEPVTQAGGTAETTSASDSVVGSVPASSAYAPSTGGGGGGGGGGSTKPQIKTLIGTVAQVNPYARSYALAIGNGPLTSVHTDSLPDPGSTVKVRAKLLANQTWAEVSAPEVMSAPSVGSSTRKRGERFRNGRSLPVEVEFSGTVTHRDQSRGLYVVSSAGVSAAVHQPDSAQGREVPAVGDLLEVRASVGSVPSASDERRLQDQESGALAGSPQGSVDRAARDDGEGCNPQGPYPLEPIAPISRLEEVSHTVTLSGITNYSVTGIVQRSCEQDDVLKISADDLAGIEDSLEYPMSEDFDLELIGVGQTFIIYVQKAGQGPVEVIGVASDQGASGADDTSSAQGVTG